MYPSTDWLILIRGSIDSLISVPFFNHTIFVGLPKNKEHVHHYNNAVFFSRVERKINNCFFYTLIDQLVQVNDVLFVHKLGGGGGGGGRGGARGGGGGGGSGEL